MEHGANLTNMLIWMHLPGLPRKFWSREVLSKGGEYHGLPSEKLLLILR